MKERQIGHLMSHYYAPRGRERMYNLGMQLAQLYLSPSDKIIGIIGESGSGKSALIHGMFPGLDLTNDDDGVYVRPLPLLNLDGGYFTPHTYHLDIRFENGFTQMSRLAEAIAEAVHRGKRVVIEHFDLVYPLLGAKADILIGVGEEVVITRPSIFGPEPEEIKDIVYKSLPYRLMAHTAEDLCEIFIPEEDLNRESHDDIKHGFVISFPYKPTFSIKEIEAKVHEMIAQKLPIAYVDEGHISIGGNIQPCSGPRVHVSNTGLVEDFHLLYHFIHDKFNDRYLMVGCVGKENLEKLRALEERMERNMKFEEIDQMDPFANQMGGMGGMGGFGGFGGNDWIF